MITLKEANREIPEVAKMNAISCISAYNGNNSYPQALISYALFLNGHEAEGKERLTNLIQKLASTKSKKGKYCAFDKYLLNFDCIILDDGYYSSYYSKDIEIHGYALLSFLRENSTDSIAQGSAMVQWLSRKMSPRGGFASTQV